jgi:CRISPR-associated protein Csd1
LWDNTAYVLGVTAKAFDPADRHEAFKALHAEALGGTDDEELVAVRRFLDLWTPKAFERAGFPEDAKDLNFVFRQVGRENFVHDNSVAKAIWAKLFKGDSAVSGACLISGEHGPIARVHPPIGSFEKEVRIVSFNEDAYRSYGHKRGDNAPVSELLAFRYTTALNRFLSKDSRNRIEIGDASTVFWAETSNPETATEAEATFVGMIDNGIAAVVAMFEAVNEQVETQKIGDILDRIRKGQPLQEVAPELSHGVRFYVLGLAPNAARLSIRFWFDNDFDVLARNYQRFVAEMRIEPLPDKYVTSLGRRLLELVPLTEGDRRVVDQRWVVITRNLPEGTQRHLSLLAADWMRAILSGTGYPQTLLSTILMRIRADGEISAQRVAILKALVIRNFKREAPVSLDPENTNKGYLLGRLFAVYEFIQTAALGRDLNSTIKDKFYGAASCTPSSVFALLDRGSVNHLSKIGKGRPGQRVNLEKRIAGIMETMNAGEDPFPVSLPVADQALFGLGYYHQRSDLFSKPETREIGEAQL